MERLDYGCAGLEIREIKLNAGYIKAGTVNVREMTCEDMKPLTLAFVGFNARQTREYFQQFVQDNWEQIYVYDPQVGWARFFDGTVVKCIPSTEQVKRDGLRYDQIILADDRRMMIWKERSELLCFLNDCCRYSQIPHDFRYQIYDIDAPEV